MKLIPRMMAMSGVLLVTTTVMAPAFAAEQAEAQQIIPAGTRRPTVGSPDFFTGRVQVEPVWPAEQAHQRLWWPCHLRAVGPVRLAHASGRPAPRGVVRRRPDTGVGQACPRDPGGDVVWCPPGVKHWHGASPGTAMSHLAVTGNVEGRTSHGWRRSPMPSTRPSEARRPATQGDGAGGCAVRIAGRRPRTGFPEHERDTIEHGPEHGVRWLTARQQAIVPIAALQAAGDIAGLNTAPNRGSISGRTISDAKEILVQLYGLLPDSPAASTRWAN